jgi:hypothetical protein
MSRRTPKNYKQAVKGPEWMEPMRKEYQNLVENDTFDLISPEEIGSKRGRVVGKDCTLEDGTKVYFIAGLWTYRIKTKNGVITSYKARFCANGKWMDCDQEETWSPTARMASIKTMFALAAVMGLEVRSGDVPGAYLQAPIGPKTEVYMKQPEGFVQEGRETSWMRLKQAVYGLPMAGQLWYSEMNVFLISLGFKQNLADPCIYWKREGHDLMIMSLTVDDILDICTSEPMRKAVIDELIRKFKYIDDGTCEWFLGMKITQDYEEITISQDDFVKTIVEEYPMAYATNAPGKPGKPLMEDDSARRPDFPYRSLCGKLRYATVTRPDIEFALNQCCRFQESPGQTHVDALMKIVGYLRKFPSLHLVFKKEGILSPTLRVSGWDDASFADQPGRKSSYGYVVCINGNAVSWKSRTTPTVATSTTHAEYVALAELLKEELHVMYLLESMEFPVEKPMLIYTDSNSAMGVAKFQRVNGRTKHIDVRYHFARENVLSKCVELRRVSTVDNVADMFTKNLPAQTLSSLLERMSLRMRL